MQLDLLVSGRRQHLDLAAQGMGSIGKASYGAVRSVRRLLGVAARLGCARITLCREVRWRSPQYSLVALFKPSE